MRLPDHKACTGFDGDVPTGDEEPADGEKSW